MYVGPKWLSTLMSATDRCTLGWNAQSDGTTTFPTLQKPKKHIVAAAHSIMASLFDWPAYYVPRSLAKSGRVIGSMAQVGALVSVFTPRITYSSLLIFSMCRLPEPNAI